MQEENRIIELLAEIRDLTKANAERYAEYAAKQEEALTIAREARKGQKKALVILAIFFTVLFLLKILV